MRILRTPGGILFTLAVFVLIFYVIAFLVKGPLFVQYGLMPGIFLAAQLALGFSLLVFLPLSFVKGVRFIARWGFLAAALIFGIAAWVFAFLVTFEAWGPIAVIIGIALAGVGVVLLGIAATVLAGQWGMALTLVLLTVCGLAARQMMLWLSKRLEIEHAPLPPVELNE